jgi:glyoxylase-like metal-dependent hydrolase (beta-lactamase superfamily II)
MRFEVISENLYLYRDTCNVYVVKIGRKAILIDWGSGSVLSFLSHLEIDSVGGVLLTHYHRDQFEADSLSESPRLKVFVPKPQQRYFEKPESVLAQRGIYHNYNRNWDGFIPIKPIRVTRAVAAGETINVDGFHFGAIAAEGHTLEPGLVCNARVDEEVIERVREELGIEALDLILVSHYHDDHVAGITRVRDRWGGALWFHEAYADILENPLGYNIPCLLPGESYGERWGTIACCLPEIQRTLRRKEHPFGLPFSSRGTTTVWAETAKGDGRDT